MKQHTQELFLKQKLELLQATYEFEVQFEKARGAFDYPAALKAMGKGAVGLKYFYGRTLSLLTSIHNHRFLEYANMCWDTRKHKYVPVAANLSEAFAALQENASRFSDPVTARIKDLEGQPGSKKQLRQLYLGQELLSMIKNAKNEAHWIDLYEQGLK